jgi:hypothetical protein
MVSLYGDSFEENLHDIENLEFAAFILTYDFNDVNL